MKNYTWEELRQILKKNQYDDNFLLHYPEEWRWGLALAFAIPAFLLEAFLLVHYLQTGNLSPHKWAGFTGLGLLVVALVAIQIGIIGDLLDRHRIYLEELLFYSRTTRGGSDALPDHPGDNKPAGR
jgi:hypothetical protein